jgi:tetratricopeptide (TPR) repeat protein
VPDQGIKELLVLNNTILNNISICFYNLEDFKSSLLYADQVLKTDVNNMKAMYRKAVCYRKMKDIERAFECIKSAFKIGTDSK